MKKSILIFSIACLGLLASNATAATLNVDQSGGAGTAAVFTPTALVPGAVPLSFIPSAQVNIAGSSVRTAFQINAYHQAVLGKSSGQGYGMASDSKKVYFLDISTVTTWTAVSGTNVSAFSGWTSL